MGWLGGWEREARTHVRAVLWFHKVTEANLTAILATVNTSYII